MFKETGLTVCVVLRPLTMAANQGQDPYCFTYSLIYMRTVLRKSKLLLLYYKYTFLLTYLWAVCQAFCRCKNPKSSHILHPGSFSYVVVSCQLWQDTIIIWLFKKLCDRRDKSFVTRRWVDAISPSREKFTLLSSRHSCLTDSALTGVDSCTHTVRGNKGT